jgi:hypothetical protein
MFGDDLEEKLSARARVRANQVCGTVPAPRRIALTQQNKHIDKEKNSLTTVARCDYATFLKSQPAEWMLVHTLRLFVWLTKDFSCRYHGPYHNRR